MPTIVSTGEFKKEIKDKFMVFKRFINSQLDDSEKCHRSVLAIYATELALAANSEHIVNRAIVANSAIIIDKKSLNIFAKHSEYIYNLVNTHGEFSKANILNLLMNVGDCVEVVRIVLHNPNTLYYECSNKNFIDILSWEH